uniref:t-SNARE coiled-coil homology domain-containing protein n=1 Tax=Ditylenchus dipsaci TaxID=166011 RepID=A0A915DHV9_9BILA
MAAYRTTANPTSNGGSFLEQQNDDMVEQKVSKLKRVTIEIGENVRDQNRLIDDMGTGFSFSGELLTNTMKKLGIVSKAGGKNVLCYLVLFCFFVFVLIYFLAR